MGRVKSQFMFLGVALIQLFTIAACESHPTPAVPDKVLDRGEDSISVPDSIAAVPTPEPLDYPTLIASKRKIASVDLTVIGLYETRQADSLTKKQMLPFSEQEFEALATSHQQNALVFRKGQAVQRDAAIELLTADLAIRFPVLHPSRFKRVRHTAVYRGMADPFSLYVLDLVDGKHAIGFLYLVDSLTNECYHLVSPFDAGCEAIVVSPNHQQFLSKANGIFDTDCFLTVMGVKREEGILKFQPRYSFVYHGYHIMEARWVGEKSIALQVTAKGVWTEEPKSPKYFLVEF